ncbi:MAG TPA: DUF4870 domain-containing protein, partial [Candidatus Polarisedimenticolaceae bacterium]|nr:DUF4870 domain-containing protein [Candidatus Polarisedimenticolaceae bacterium]
KSESRIVSSIAKQALLLNVIAFALLAASVILWVTVILIPVVILFWIVLGITAVVLPIVGAIKALDGWYYRYPVVGIQPV